MLPCIMALCALASAPTSDDTPVDYAADVKPILELYCYECHGPVEPESGLRLDSYPGILKGSEAGPIVEKGQAAESILIDVLEGKDGHRMPPEGDAVPDGEIAVIRRWIDQGAGGPEDEKAVEAGDHWSFRPPVRTTVPDSTDRFRNPIDAFLAVGRQKHGLTAAPEADRATLLRRVALDLTGLAPTREELAAFIADPAPDAYEKAVDRLLDAPTHGERWARHWMDVWRYSDWYGFGAEVRNSQPHIWRWRDWIVESLNKDAPYDRMVVQMLAADEQSPGDADALRATGFLVRPWYKFNRTVWLEAAVEHTSKAFLGLTVNCAKCHDHKYDPIEQADFYRFRAVFEPYEVRTDLVPGQSDTTKDGLVSAFDAKADEPTYLFEQGDEARPVKDKPLTVGLPTVFGVVLRAEPVPLPPTAYYPGLRRHVREALLADAAKAEAVAGGRWLAALLSPLAPKSDPAQAALEWRSARSASASLAARIVADDARYDPKAIPTLATQLARSAARAEREAAAARATREALKAERILSALKAAEQPDAAKVEALEKALAGTRKAEVIAKAAIEVVAADYPPITPVHPSTSTGRRLALARWIASRDNPLTARVAVNQVWMRHFGAPLVSTVFDFGRKGSPPSHPELLDWLAVEFMESGWSMKKLHRLIVTSAAYRMRSSGTGPDDPNAVADPGNAGYWRMNPRRMEAELVRDNVLHLAGTLDPAMGGAEIDQSADQTTPRRSLYFRHAAEKQAMFLKLFDVANVNACYRRDETVVPQQALALANSPLVLAQAKVLARRLGEGCGEGPEAFVAVAFEQVLGRSPTPEERAACIEYLAARADRVDQAREGLVHVLYNHNDFVTIR